MIKLNNISQKYFEVEPQEYGGSRERADIISCGRLLMVERNGKDYDHLRVMEKKPSEYTPKLDSAAYAKTNQNLKEKLFLYAAKMACNMTGEAAPQAYDEFLKKQRRFMSDKAFLKVLSGIISEIVYPVLPAVMSNALSYLCETVYVPLGETYEISVGSNDIFVFEDDSWGASRSKGSNYLYNYPITLNPQPYTAKATVKWYQMVGNNVDLGLYFNSIAAGLYSKINALWYNAMTTATANTQFVPTGLKFTGNTTENWIKAIERVSAVNNTGYNNVIAFGTYSTLAQALPSGIVNASTQNLDAALSTMLGIEWARYGYLAEYMGAKLMPIQNVIVPGTQNTAVTPMLENDVVWLMSAGGYKPIYMAMEEGTPITVELDPRETGDMTLDIIVTASMDVKPVFGSKIATLSYT